MKSRRWNNLPLSQSLSVWKNQKPCLFGAWLFLCHDRRISIATSDVSKAGGLGEYIKRGLALSINSREVQYRSKLVVRLPLTMLFAKGRVPFSTVSIDGLASGRFSKVTVSNRG